MNTNEQSEPTPTPQEEVNKRIDRILSELNEFCDSVRVFVTYPSDDGENETIADTFGAGNFYAQLGQVDQWLARRKEMTREQARQEMKEDQEEGD